MSSEQLQGHVPAARHATLRRGWDLFSSITSDLFAVFDEGWRFQEISASWEQALGYRIEDMIDKRPIDFLHPDDIPKVLEGLAAIDDGRTPRTTVNRYRRKDGTYAWMSWSSVVVIDGLKYCAARDISVHEEAQAALRTAHDRLQRLLGACRVVLFSFAMGHPPTTTFVSENVIDVFGYAPEDFLNDVDLWVSCVHPDDKERILAESAALVASGACLREYRFRHKDGSYLWVQDECKLVRDAEGRPVEVVGSWQDISARKENERTIQQQAEALRELSTPLIPVSDEILVMPLIGVVDSQRAAQVMGALLDGITARNARYVIIDVTGVGIIDTAVADLLLRTANAARLLGVQALLTGIRPHVAQTLVSLDVDLRTVMTFGTLQAGIQYAMRHLGARAHR